MPWRFAVDSRHLWVFIRLSAKDLQKARLTSRQKSQSSFSPFTGHSVGEQAGNQSACQPTVCTSFSLAKSLFKTFKLFKRFRQSFAAHSSDSNHQEFSISIREIFFVQNPSLEFKTKKQFKTISPLWTQRTVSFKEKFESKEAHNMTRFSQRTVFFKLIFCFELTFRLDASFPLPERRRTLSSAYTKFLSAFPHGRGLRRMIKVWDPSSLIQKIIWLKGGWLAHFKLTTREWNAFGVTSETTSPTFSGRIFLKASEKIFPIKAIRFRIASAKWSLMSQKSDKNVTYLKRHLFSTIFALEVWLKLLTFFWISQDW